MPRRRLSLRAQMTLGNVGIVALALTVFGVGLLVTMENLLTRQVDRLLEQRIARLQGRGGPPPPLPPGGFPPGPDGRGGIGGIGGGGGPRGPEPGHPAFPGARGPERFPPGPGGRGVGVPRGGPGPGEPFPHRILDAASGRDPVQGEPLSPAGFQEALRRAGGGVVFTAEMAEVGPDPAEPVRVLSVPVRRDGQVVAVLQVAEPVREIRNARNGLVRALLLMIPGALLLAGAGGALLTRRALLPVGRLAEAAGRIGASNLSERLPAPDDDEFGRLALTFNGMLERLEAAFSRQRRFTADASHELRTPLAVIKANSSLMREEAESLAPEQQESLQAIDEAADRANRIVRDLLFLARAEGVGASLPVQTSEVEVAPVVRRAWEAATAARRAEAAGQEARPLSNFHAAVPDGLRLHTDRDHLTRLLTNLLENAARHTPPEGSVTVTAAASGPVVTFTVSDTGEGIAPEHLARLGEPFYRPDASRSRARGGSGLGLAICRTLARALGGDLKIESTLGKGTTVTVTLPSVLPSG